MPPPELRKLLRLGVGLVVAACAGLAFLELADDLRDGETVQFDEGVLSWLATHRTATRTKIALALTALGSWPLLTLLAAGSCMALLLASKHRFALTLLAAMAGAPLLSIGLKRMYGRERPTIVPHLETVADPSFPSGHTIASVCFFVTVAFLTAAYTRRRPLRVFLIGYALLVGALVAFSRVYLGVHYPSDVVGGALLGVGWSLSCVIGDSLLRRAAQRWRSGPKDEELSRRSAENAS